MGSFIKNQSIMKTIVISITLALCSFICQNLEAQEKSSSEEKRREFFQEKMEQIVNEEKALLKYKVERINERFEKSLITSEEASNQKKEAAEKHAKNIENRLAILENETELRARNESFQGYIALGENGKILDIKVNEERERLYDKRTTTDLVLAVGFNNALEEGQSLNDSDFKLAGSRFFEIGWAWKTRVFDKSNWLRVKYGVSFQFNGLKPTDNRYFVENDKETQLENFEYDLKKSKFRMDNLVVPVHFEFGPSTKIETDRSIRYSTVGKLKIGLGGYAGFNIGERQKLKYEVDGEKVKEKLKNDYNTNDLVYGVSAYLGWGGATLYGKYDLNPIFKDPNRELHNFSLGLRFDVD